MNIQFHVFGKRDTVVAELVERATESPESEIRGAIADHITRRCDEDARLKVTVNIIIEGD
jgi:hypothetical protein